MELQRVIDELEDQAHQELIARGVLPRGPSDLHIYAATTISGVLNELAYRIKQEVDLKINELTDFLPFDD